MRRLLVLLSIALAVFTTSALAADYSRPQEGDRVTKGFRFHAGEVTPERRLHDTTLGDPKNPPQASRAPIGPGA